MGSFLLTQGSRVTSSHQSESSGHSCGRQKVLLLKILGSDCSGAQSHVGDLAKNREQTNDLEHHSPRLAGEELH